jgi:hypothetical protein
MIGRARKRIVLAWHGPLTAASIGGQYHVTARRVRQIWADAISDGALPHTPRPHFRACVIADDDRRGQCAAPADDYSDSQEAIAIDGHIARSERRAEMSQMRIPNPDPLLAALHRAHGNDRRRRFVLRVPDDRIGDLPSLRDSYSALALARRWDDAMARFSIAGIATAEVRA